MRQTIKLLAVIEATTVTGPAKNLINFCRGARSAEWESNNLPRVETSIVTFQRGASDSHSLSNSNSQHGATNVFIAAARDAGITVDVLYERFRFDPKVIAQLRRAVEDRAPDIIQTHMIKSHFLIKLSGLARRYPWIAFHHGYTTTDRKMQIYNQLNRWSLPSADRVITVCGPFAEQLSAAGVRRDRIVVRHNSVDVATPRSEESKRALRQRLGIADDERVVLTVGRLSYEKGYIDLLRSLTVLRENNAALNFKLVIVGEGPERARLERESHRSGLSDHVIFASQTNDVQTYYEIAHVLALPSHSEGSPNVLLEGMAAALPVVATAVGGVPEIAINEETALLVPPRDAQSFARALERVLRDASLARTLGAAAAQHVREEFSPTAYVSSLLNVYQGLAPEEGKADNS